MNTICITFRGHVECPAYFNVFPLLAATVEPTRIVLAHPLNYSADRALLRFFARSPRIFDLLSIANYPSFTDVTHNFKLGSPPVAPPRRPPRKNPSKIDWSLLEPRLGQSSEPICLLMKPYTEPLLLVENLRSPPDVRAILHGSRVVSHNTMFYAPVDSSLDAQLPPQHVW